LETSKAYLSIQSQRDTIEALLPETVEELFAWLTNQTRDEVLALLAFCTAMTALAVEERERPNPGDTLARAVHLDMREWWTPTASYFQCLPKERILAVVSEAVDPNTAAPLAKLKKGVMAAAAAETVGRTEWLPKPLRTPT